ncbi:hypothetical protein [Halomarina litorea]|uniref:hypothetical protein n=1 Tax=Halomarina litorea TaxID=2961595 RepID=UPI0020C29421|nr:hypothetical protein [Halomarina sp. BCD28]
MSDTDLDLSAAEREALHRAELSVEWLRRAHGHLVSFHHNTGHAMDHLAAAEELFREAGHEGLADALRDDLLPRGVVAERSEGGEHWSYDVLEDFEAGFLPSVVEFEATARDRLADGRRHITEREQEREWRRRARR